MPGAHVDHQHRRHDDLVGRDRDDVGQQDHAVEADRLPERVEEPFAMCCARLVPPT